MTTTRKTSKKALAEAVDTFFWSLAWVTGGTLEETLRQADHAITRLEAKAAIVAALAANPAKLCAADDHLMSRAAVVPARLENYRTRYVGQYATWKAEQAAKRAGANVTPFPLSD
jgi:hypothetical protein